MDETLDLLPHISCTSDYVDLGLYDPVHLHRPTLRFEVEDVGGTLARLAEVGISSAGELPSPLRQVPAAVLAAPEGTPLLLSSNA
jgi:hypothetical protein